MGDIINIPSIFIDEDYGYILKNSIDDGKNGAPMMVIEFNLNKVDIAHYYFFLNLPSKEAFVMIREFDSYRQKLEDKAIFQPVYEFFPCWSCSSKGYTED